MTTNAPTNADRIALLASVEYLSATPGNEWEAGSHNVAPANALSPTMVPRGMTHYVNLRNASGAIVIANVRYQTGSALSHDHRGKPIRPSAAEIIHSLILDADCASERTFDDFCAEFGYSTDSRKALNTYLQCQEVDAQLRRGFSAADLDTLRTLTEEM